MSNIEYFTQDEVDQFDSPERPSHARFKELEGERIGKLKVIKYYGKKVSERNNKSIYWFCKCDCGKIVLKSSGSLASVNSKNQCFTCTRKEKHPDKWRDWLRRFKEKHGDYYDYSHANFTGSGKDKIKIICPVHGEFWQRPEQHVKSSCYHCGRAIASENRKLTSNEILSRFKEVHGDFYDYSKMVYIRDRLPVIIICPIHGEFQQQPKVHCKGGGCPVCRYIKSSSKLRKTTADFIKDAVKVHGDLYDYSKVDYWDCSRPVTIVCKVHGEFEQQPTIHLCGYGCNRCSSRGYNAEGGGYFYITSLNDYAIKYGISSDPHKRLKEQSGNSRFVHKILYSFYFEDGYIPKLIEQTVSLEVGKNFLTKNDLSDGYTETCSIDKLLDILDIVEQYGGSVEL